MKDDKLIRQKRFEAQLVQLLNEAFADLNDPIFASITIVRVIVSKGKYDARVFISCDENESADVLTHLKHAKNAIRDYCLKTSGWFRCPKLHFEIDTSLETEKRLLLLLDNIAQKDSHE